ncbi:helix-turn-helix domain-containing protein [Streptomyces sp. NPDC001678]|uniref:helix-turn-helix domain-containing protein n=1 Tax=Streptomyces sp. NPDC001678 TaxID=3364599 RepID=UPI0036B86890
MPPRTNPTARQVRLGSELRKLRERAGVAARDAARVAGVDQGKMSLFESGRAAVSEERLRRLVDHYGVADSALVDALVALAIERGRGWWEKYRGDVGPNVLDLAALEWHSRAMQSLQIMHVPGILQCESYTRALFVYLSSHYTPDRVNATVRFRMQRRKVLDRENPPTFTAIIHEAALRMRVGDRKVAREQLDHVLSEAERPNVTIRVVPFEAERFAGMGYSMLYLAADVPRLDTVQVDHVHGTVFFGAEEELDRYRNRWRQVEESALSPVETRDFLHRVASEL